MVGPLPPPLLMVGPLKKYNFFAASLRNLDPYNFDTHPDPEAK